jgi:hypothetical protein
LAKEKKIAEGLRKQQTDGASEDKKDDDDEADKDEDQAKKDAEGVEKVSGQR